MAANSKPPWPSTYLGRLQAVAYHLQDIGQPASIEMLLERFSGVTADQIEATLAALVLFGRAEKVGELFTAPKGS